MVCVPCVLVPLLLFLWGMIKPLINWFRRTEENSEATNENNDDQVCSLLSSCPCINKNNSVSKDHADNTQNVKTLQKEPLEVSGVDKKNM